MNTSTHISTTRTPATQQEQQEKERWYRRLARVSPWTAGAILAAAAIGTYSAYAGFQYLNVTRQTKAAEEQVRKAAIDLRRGVLDVEGAKAEAIRSARQLEELKAAFSQPLSDSLVKLAAEASEQAGVELMSIMSPEQMQTSFGGTTFTTQPLVVTVQGSPENIGDFVARIKAGEPTATISSLSISGEVDPPAANIQFIFYLLPEGQEEGVA